MLPVKRDWSSLSIIRVCVCELLHCVSLFFSGVSWRELQFNFENLFEFETQTLINISVFSFSTEIFSCGELLVKMLSAYLVMEIVGECE